MDALIIIAHGSKVQSSNDEIKNIADKLRLNSNNSLYVSHCFLELAEPLISTCINKIIEKNYTKIKIFPYFLAAGKHVKIDIPNEIDVFKKKYPDIEFILLPHIGQCNGIEDMILSNI